MAEKIEIEKPIVSKELAKQFECFKTKKDDIFALDSKNYKTAEEYGLNCEADLAKTIAEMYVLDYEVEKPKHYVLELPVKNADKVTGYVCKTLDEKSGYRFIGIGWLNYSDGFTKSEIESDEGLNKLASVCELVEVEN